MLKKLFKFIIIAALAAVPAVLLFGFVIPIRLEVEVDPDKLYRYEDLTRDDVSVYLSPLFKRGNQIYDFTFSKESSEQYDDITVQETIFYKKEHIRNVKLNYIDAVYESDAHEGDPFDVSKVLVTAVYKDDSTQRLTDFEVLNQTKTISLASDMVVKTDLGSAKLYIPFDELVELTAEYPGAREGDDFDESKVVVNLVRDGGDTLPVKNFSCDGADVLRGESHYTVYTTYGKVPLVIDPMPVVYVTSPEEYAENMVFHGKILMTYEDDSERIIESDDVDFGDTDLTLHYGINQLPFTWKGMAYTLYINASATTPVSVAAETLVDEISQSIYNEVSSDFFMTVRRVDGDPSFMLTHVVLGNPSQMAVESANGMYGRGTEALASAAKRTDWTIGINGSFYEFNGLPVMASCMIRNGQIISGGITTGCEICLTSGGALFSPPAGISAQDLAAQGVKDILISTDPLLMQDGQIYSEGDTVVGGTFPRTAIGMTVPGEYYIVSSASGMTYSQMQSLFAGLGCAYARSLDGGKSVALYYKDLPVDNMIGRPVADFLYFKK